MEEGGRHPEEPEIQKGGDEGDEGRGDMRICLRDDPRKNSHVPPHKILRDDVIPWDDVIPEDFLEDFLGGDHVFRWLKEG